MALLFMDGFDHYATSAEMARKWSVVDIAGFVTGRSGSGQAVSLSNFDDLTVSMGAKNNITIGMAIYRTTSSTVTIDFRSSSNVDNIAIELNPDGSIELLRGGTTTLATSTYTIPYNAWVYLEIYGYVDNTAGRCEVRANGTTVIDYTGDTYNLGNVDITQIRIENHIQIDDLYVVDNTGAVNNSFLGDVRVETLYPSGDATPNDFTATGAGTTNADRVQSMDDDTTYLSSDTIGHQEQFTLDDLPSGVTPIAVQQTTTARKDGVGARGLANRIVSGATTDTGADTGLSDGQYTSIITTHDVDPNTSAAWTKAGVDALEVGFEVTS